ncbi:MAG: alpha-L-fucosidase, partial [Armatimonadota bacterium]
MMMAEIPDYWQWFNNARFGQFIHWGAYSVYGRGEQVLFREHLDQDEYAQVACDWNPENYDPTQWAEISKNAGMKYAVLTTRHHDGFCLWDSEYTDYCAPQQAAGRDLVGEYVEAFREAGLRVGLYYSFADWRIPAYWQGPQKNPDGWQRFREYVHNQVRELLTNYGRIDIMWFDGSWPHSVPVWGNEELEKMIRKLQPKILINNRIGRYYGDDEGPDLGDFGTPEQHIKAEDRLWEACMVSGMRLWGHVIGERWRPTDVILDFLVETASLAGNLLLNVGPTSDGRYPDEYIAQLEAIGEWMDAHDEAIYGSEAGDVCEFITYGRQTRKGNNLYLHVRFWDGRREVHLAGLKTSVKRAELLTTGEELPFEQSEDHLYVRGLPQQQPTELFPVIKLECEGPPKPCDWAEDRLWSGDPD